VDISNRERSRLPVAAHSTKTKLASVRSRGEAEEGER